jgi:hypothetical protein
MKTKVKEKKITMEMEKAKIKENNYKEKCLKMNKKIISIIFLLIVVISLTLVYDYYNNSTSEDSNYDSPIQTIDENNISEEIDNLFIEEDDEIEIGEIF